MKINFNYIYQEFLNEFNSSNKIKNINSKDYNTTLIRNIFIYYLYKLYKAGYIEKREEILSNFKNNDISYIHKNVKKIEEYIKKPKLNNNKNELFSYYYYRFHKIYINILNYNTIQMNNKIIEPSISADEYTEIMALNLEVNPSNYELRSTDVKNVYKITDKKSKLRYTSSLNALKKKEIIYKNIKDKDLFYKEKLNNQLLEKTDHYYQSLLIDKLHNIFYYVHFYHPNIIE